MAVEEKHIEAAKRKIKFLKNVRVLFYFTFFLSIILVTSVFMRSNIWGIYEVD